MARSIIFISGGAHDERYLMADEYLTIWHRLMAGECLTHKGKHFQTEGAKFDLPAGTVIQPPALWFGGSSDADVGLVRPGSKTAIIGSPNTLVRKLETYQKVGVDTFILPGMSLLEEGYRFDEFVLPKLPFERLTPERKPFTWSTMFDRNLSGKPANV